MKKKPIVLIILSLFILALAAVAVLTALRLQQIGTEPVAPTAGRPSRAAAPVCTFTFTVAASPSPSPSVSPSPSPSGSPRVSPSPSPSARVSPSPSPLATCRSACTLDIDCAGSLICVNNLCVNPQCQTDTNCICDGSPRPSAPVGSAPPQVALPEAGVSWPTIGILSAGLVTVLLGVLALAL